ncbi:MAG: FAD-binding oxidoreductase [bacterium]
MSIVARLQEVLPDDQISDHPDQLAVASHDESTLPGIAPLAVVWALTTREIQKVVRLCADMSVPITSRGAGSALEGSTIPSASGIVLDLSRMNRVVQIWPDDLQVMVEPGIVYDDLNAQLKSHGLFFPPSPGGSGDIATVGGMVSTNASGIYSVKYGGTRDYVLRLEIVTGSGEIMTLGSRAVKRSSGYNLVDLVCGSEGTLCVISKITLRLAGLPEGRLQAAYSFDDDIRAARAVSDMARYGLDVAAVEFFDRAIIQALNLLKDYGLDESPSLFLEFHGPEATLTANNELASEICREHGGRPLRLADGLRPWEIRHWATDAVKHRKPGCSIVRNDVAFPISCLPEMVAYCHELGTKYKLTTHAFGHVGMGLLHALILADQSNPSQWQLALKMSNEIIEKTIALEGTISGEHGIGLGHKNLFALEHGHSVELMRAIKRQWDPLGILNPGKIFDV